MIWIILFFIIILVSGVLAFRSMRDYEEFPKDLSLNSIFFLGNPQILSAAILSELYFYLLANKSFFSVERLIKGREKAIVIFGPKELPESFPQLNLVELEDYLGEASNGESSTTGKKVNINETITWVVDPKSISKRKLNIDFGKKEIELKENQKVFIQIVGEPYKDRDGEYFQSTIRIMVSDSDSIDRISLAKKVSLSFLEATGLNKHEDNFTEGKKFESFKKRTLIPKEVADFRLTPQEIFDIVA